MNVANFRQLADLIEANKEKFNLNKFIDTCNTTACVAGWCYVIQKGRFVEADEDSVVREAQQFLDIDYWQANRLFYAGEGSVWGQYASKYNLPTMEHDSDAIAYGFWSSVPAEMAVEVLRDIADGKVEL